MSVLGAAPMLLIEDDPSIRRFVALALEDLPVDLQVAASLADARARLLERPWRLILTDLMLPDGSALQLLADAAARAHAGRAVWAVMSAGLTPTRRAELDALGVLVALDKPVSLGTLVAAVQDILQGIVAAPAAEPGASSAPFAAPGPDPAPARPADPRLSPAQAEAVAHHFGGDLDLYLGFREDVLTQLPHDLDAGEQACLHRDFPALRRRAHSLKSVLTLLGEPALAATAQAVEQAAAGAADPALARQAQQGWPDLAAGLRRVLAG